MNIFSLFKRSKSVPQTGLIFKGPQKPDAFSGVNPRLTGAKLNIKADWTDYLPNHEKQSKPFSFDTLSCTTFSSLNAYEIVFNFMLKNNLFSDFHVKFLKNNGYINKEGSVDFSDRFIAILSNTTTLGNDHVSVMTCIRKNGLIPEADFPFGGNSFEAYHNKSLITEQMKEKGLRFKNLFETVFQWSFVADYPDFSPAMRRHIENTLEESPIAIAIELPATHAITLYKVHNNSMVNVLDHYEPATYRYKASRGIHFGLQVGVIQKQTRQYPDHVFNTVSIPYGSSNIHVTALQQVLCAEGLLNERYVTGNFLQKTQEAFIKWQRIYGLVPDGKCGKKSIEKLNELCKKKI